jgi:hypothetical protein
LSTSHELLVELGKLVIKDILRDLGSFAGTGFTDEDENLSRVVLVEELLSTRDGEVSQ